MSPITRVKVAPNSSARRVARKVEMLHPLDTLDYVRIWEQPASSLLAESSLKQYRYMILSFMGAVKTYVPAVTNAQVRAYLSSCTPRMANQYRAALLHFYEILERRGICDSPIDAPFSPVPANEDVLVLTTDELNRVLVAASWGWSDGRAALFLAQYAVVARPGEFTLLDTCDVHRDEENPYVVFRHTKGRKVRRVPLEGISLEAFKMIDLDHPGKVVHVGRGQYWNWFKHACELAEIPEEKSHPHVLRRTGITDMLRRGAKVEAVQKIAGHTNVETTMRYYRFVYEEERREALRLL